MNRIDTTRRPLGRAMTSAMPRRSVLLHLGGLGAGLALGSGFRPALAQVATPVPPPFFTDWLAAWAEDPNRADALYTADSILEDVPFGAVYRGLDEIKAHIEQEFAAFPDHGYEIRSAFAAGDWAAAEVILSGTYTGAVPGLPPGEGQPITIPSAAIFALADGKIRREAHYYDVYGFLVQLGVVPAPGAEAGTPGS